MATMKSITARGTRLEQLKQLAKQYRETIREIEEIEGAKDDTDEIGAILAQREHDGKSGAVRTYRTGVSGD